MSYIKTNGKNVRQKLSQIQRDVLLALISMYYKTNSVDPIEKKTIENKIGIYQDVYFSIQDIQFKIKKNIHRSLRKDLEKIESKYQSNDSKSDKIRFEKNKLNNKYRAYHLKNIQRALSELQNKGLVIMKGKKYAPSDQNLTNIYWNLELMNEQIFRSIMKLHTPLLNGIEKNVEGLVNLFGSYVFLTLLEISRPFDDNSYRNRPTNPMTLEEKNRFIESLLSNIFQTESMYQIFLETFLNQIDEVLIRRIKIVKFKEKCKDKFIYTDENGKEYNHLVGVNSDLTRFIFEDESEYNPESLNSLKSLKKVPSSITPRRFANSISLSESSKYYYELDSDTYKFTKKAFSNLYPQIYQHYENSLWGALGGGVKEDMVKDLSDVIA